MRLRAILFDVDGTLAETEEAHRQAFNRTFAEAGKDWSWSQDENRDLLQVTGGQERLAEYVSQIGETLADEDIATLHQRKNELYAEAVADGQVIGRPGVARLIGEARNSGVRLAIATSTSRENLLPLLDRLFGPEAVEWFDVIATGDHVSAKKPDPEVYRSALHQLGLQPQDCVAIEDSRHGLDAASACGIPVVVTPSFYSGHENFDGAALVRASLEGPPPVDLAELERILALTAPETAAP